MHYAKTATSLVSIAALIVSALFTGCASNIKIVDTKETGARGYVGFISSLDLRISELRSDGSGDEKTFWFRHSLMDKDKPEEYLVAAAPGTHSFALALAEGRGFQRTVRVEVRADSITYVSLLSELLQRDSYSILTTLGSHSVPLSPVGDFSSTLLAALDDSDWGTRTAALSRLRDWKVALSPYGYDRLRSLVRDERLARPASVACALLVAAGKSLPEPSLYFFSFVDRSDNFPEDWKAETFECRYTSGGYAISSYGDNVTIRERAMPIDSAIKDFDIELDCAWQEGNQDEYYGLILGEDQGNQFRFLLTQDGSAIASQVRGNELVSPAPIPFRSRSAQSTLGGAGMRGDRIVLRLRGERCEFTANGEALGSFDLSPDFGLASFGIIVEGRQTVAFSRLAIYAR